MPTMKNYAKGIVEIELCFTELSGFVGLFLLFQNILGESKNFWVF